MQDDATTSSQFRNERAEGLAVAALALGLVSFLNLLGAEKAILAMVLGVSALRSTDNHRTRTWASLAIGLGVVYVLTIGVVLIAFGDKLGELLNALRALG